MYAKVNLTITSKIIPIKSKPSSSEVPDFLDGFPHHFPTLLPVSLHESPHVVSLEDEELHWGLRLEDEGRLAVGLAQGDRFPDYCAQTEIRPRMIGLVLVRFFHMVCEYGP